MLKTGDFCWLIFLANTAANDFTINKFNVSQFVCRMLYLLKGCCPCLQVHVLQSALMEQVAQRQVTVIASYFRLKEAGAKLVSLGPKESSFGFK